MKFFTCLLLLLPFWVEAQFTPTIELHSITTTRQSSFDMGYTLNGLRMLGSRAKLLSPTNFGENGTYPKAINITDAYGNQGDLSSLKETENIDLFYFGTFDLDNSSLIQFTTQELEDVYLWSLNHKMIIGASSSNFNSGFNPSVLNDFWGFDIQFVNGVPGSPTLFLPTEAGQTLFDGPFGKVETVAQGGSAQGFFSTMPEDVIVLSNTNGKVPAIYLDCQTLDLVIADGDVHNDLGGVTPGSALVSDNDIFWANTIAYMDGIGEFPHLDVDGQSLNLPEAYSEIRWYLNGEVIEDATGSSYVATESGVYTAYVLMDCGCYKWTPEFMFFLSSQEQIGQQEFKIYPNPFQDYLTIDLDNTHQEEVFIDLFDSKGQLISSTMTTNSSYTMDNLTELVSGTYLLRVVKGSQLSTLRLVKN